MFGVIFRIIATLCLNRYKKFEKINCEPLGKRSAHLDDQLFSRQLNVLARILILMIHVNTFLCKTLRHVVPLLEPHRGKTNNLHRRKERRRSASR